MYVSFKESEVNKSLVNISFWVLDISTHHQTLHFFAGFMGEPSGQFQSLANSARLENGPLTLKLDGEWGSVRT